MTKDEIRQLVEICMEFEPDFFKTSTGVNGKASADSVRFLKELTDEGIAIKASGGIRTIQDMQKYIDLGATRIGTSSGVKIMEETLQN